MKRNFVEVNYRTAKSAHHNCTVCANFIEPNLCKYVESIHGTVLRGGVCDELFEPKKDNLQ
jgi:hypothetical protein